MIASATAMLRHPGVFFTVRGLLGRSAVQRRLPMAAATAYQTALTGLKLVAGVLAGATVTLAVMSDQSILDPASTDEPGRNETVVYRRAPLKSRAPMPPIEAPVDVAEENTSAYYPPAVQTIRFVNPDPSPNTFTLAAIVQPMTKVGGFVAFPAREDASESEVSPLHRGTARPGFPRKRAITPLAEVDEYLWEVYQRAPIKKDRSGDFTWKDPAAAARVGLTLKEYVIAGMDPDFREQLYHAGRAMDAEGVQWAILSAFRDDYRQKIAAGFKARGGNSLHGGSRRTGGFGNGRAVDVTSADGDHSAVWKWLDANGSKYGLHRPMPGNDPAHLQTKGDWRKIAQSFRQARVKIVEKTGASGKEAAAVTKVVAVDGAKP